MTRILPPALSSWLASLSPRERLLLVAGAIALVLAVVVLGIWQPLRADRAAELGRIARYDRMLAALSQLPAATHSTADPRPIATILAQTAAAQGLSILRLDTPRTGTATLTLKDAPFETLVLWIDGLNHDSGLAITSATIRRSETPGTVSADLSLERDTP